MKLREQTLISLLPLFLALAVLGNGAAWWLRDHRLRHELQQSAVTVAVALSETLTPSPAQAMDPDLLERLARWQLVDCIQVVDATGQVVQRWGVAAGEADPALRQRMLQAGSRGVSGDVQLGERGEGAVWAGAPILNRAHEVVGGVGVRRVAEGFGADLAGARWTLVMGTAWSTGLGLLVVGALGTFMGREVKRLSTSSRGGEPSVAASAQPQELRIAELRDLGETQVVIQSLRREAEAKVAALQRHDLGGSVADQLARALQTRWMPVVDRPMAGRQVVLGAVGEQIERAWHGVTETGEVAWLWFGTVREQRGVDAVRWGAAMTAELAERLDGSVTPDPVAALQRLRQGFPVGAATVLTWSRQDASTRVWRLAGEGVSEEAFVWRGHGAWHDLAAEEADLAEAMVTGAAEAGATLTLADLRRVLTCPVGVVASLRNCDE